MDSLREILNEPLVADCSPALSAFMSWSPDLTEATNANTRIFEVNGLQQKLIQKQQELGRLKAEGKRLNGSVEEHRQVLKSLKIEKEATEKVRELTKTKLELQRKSEKPLNSSDRKCLNNQKKRIAAYRRIAGVRIVSKEKENFYIMSKEGKITEPSKAGNGQRTFFK